MKQKKSTHLVLSGLAAVLVTLSVGCARPGQPGSQATSQTGPPPSNDGQVTTQVQGQLHRDAALNNLPIQVQVINGVVTLSGTVNDQAARELAANDTAQINGVRTVVNNLIVQQAQAPAAAAAETAAAEQQEKDAEAARLEAARQEAAKQQAARLRKQKQEQARAAQRQQQLQQQQAAQEAQQQAQNNPPPPPPVAAAQTLVQQAPPPPPPPPKPVTETITIPAGTDLPIRISESLETGKTQPNDPFHGALADNMVVNGKVAIRRGASVTGEVLDAKDATHFKGNAMLSLELLKIKTPNKTLKVVTDPLVQQGKGRGKDTAVKAGGAALFGTLLGALAGGGKGALIGGAAGAGAGAGVNAVTRGQQVKIPSESILHFKLSQPLQVTITSTPGSQQPVTSYSNDGTPQLQQPN